MRRYTRRIAAPLSVIHWVGLFWVYSSAILVVMLYQAAVSNDVAGCLILTPRLALTLAIGVGLCGTERWSWAAGTVAAGLISAEAALLASAAGAAILTQPAWYLPWQPLFLGLDLALTRRLAFWAPAVALLYGILAVLLWREREECDVASRGAFHALGREGILAGGALAGLDLLLLWRWVQLHEIGA